MTTCRNGHPNPPRRGDGRCAICARAHDAQRNQTTRRKQQRSGYQWERNLRLKTRVFAQYGTVCQCCGESHIAFLVLDHIEDNGGEERRAMKTAGKSGSQGGWVFYKHLEREGFPPGYQVLCVNCNHAKQYWRGVCPHKE